MGSKWIRMGAGMLLVTAMVIAAIPLAPVGAAPIITNVRVTNINNGGFVVSWKTDTASNGTVTWGTSSPPTQVAVDPVSSTTTHYVTISGLTQNTLHYFQVSSTDGTGSTVDNNSGAYYTVTTGAELISGPGQNLIWGVVYQSNGSTPVANAIVYLVLQDANGSGSMGASQMLSSRSGSNGVWGINLVNVRTSDNQNYYSYTLGGDHLSIIAQGGVYGTRGILTPWTITLPAVVPAQQNIILSEAPTAVTLSSFSGSTQLRTIQLNWETAQEMGLDGFNVWRSETLDGNKVKQNGELIVAQHTGQNLGGVYQYSDVVSAGKSYYYWLEQVQTNKTEMTGPVILTTDYMFHLPVIRR